MGRFKPAWMFVRGVAERAIVITGPLILIGALGYLRPPAPIELRFEQGLGALQCAASLARIDPRTYGPQLD